MLATNTAASLVAVCRNGSVNLEALNICHLFRNKTIFYSLLFILPCIEVYITAIFMRHLGIKDSNRPFSLCLNSCCAKWLRRMKERNAFTETQSDFSCCIPAIAKCAFNISKIVHFSKHEKKLNAIYLLVRPWCIP